ncbi:MAG: hypothetical protein KDC79_00365 [Cyclobacteriaceae bacterium]|nr:hypothetical protein [Cyclobacteriaceae bacterium]
MKKQLTLFILIFLVMFSCSNDDKERLKNQLTFSYRANEGLANDIKSQNDTLVDILGKFGYEKELKIRNITNETLKHTQHLKDTLLFICGGRDWETGSILNPDEVRLVSSYIFNSKEGSQLKENINRVPEFIKTYNPNFYYIANDAKDFKEFSNDPNQKDKTFRDLFFENNNLIGCLNAIAYLEVEIVLAENKFLNSLMIKELSKKSVKEQK